MIVFSQFDLAIYIIQIYRRASVASGCLVVIGVGHLMILHVLLFFVILWIILRVIVQQIHLSLEEAAASTGHWQSQKRKEEGYVEYATVIHEISDASIIKHF